MNKFIFSQKLVTQIQKIKKTLILNFKNNYIINRKFNNSFINIMNYEDQEKFYWIRKTEKNVNIMGLNEDTISIMEGINEISVNKRNNFIMKDEPLFSFISSQYNYETIYSPNNLLIVDINDDILNKINIDPESDDSWIIKFVNKEEFFPQKPEKINLQKQEQKVYLEEHKNLKENYC